MNKYGMIVFLVAFAGQVGCLGDESSWVIENYEALKAKDFKTHIVLSINTNPSSVTKTVFEDADMMIEVVSIIADGVDVTAAKSNYDAEVYRRKKVIAEPNQRARLRLEYSVRSYDWSLYLVPSGNILKACVYYIPGDTKEFIISYRLLAPDLSKSEVMTTVVRIR